MLTAQLQDTIVCLSFLVLLAFILIRFAIVLYRTLPLYCEYNEWWVHLIIWIYMYKHCFLLMSLNTTKSIFNNIHFVLPLKLFGCYARYDVKAAEKWFVYCVNIIQFMYLSHSIHFIYIFFSYRHLYYRNYHCWFSYFSCMRIENEICCAILFISFGYYYFHVFIYNSQIWVSHVNALFGTQKAIEIIQMD